MRIIFIRHGIAEDRNLGKEDHLRDLTAEGIKELKRNAVFMGVYLKESNPILLTSSLNRAVQTVNILNQYGKYGGIIEKDYIGNGDFVALKNDLIKSSYEDVVIVGHSPYLEEWVYDITLSVIDFKKGGACEVEITNMEDFTGKTNWYLDIDEYPRLIKSENYNEAYESLRIDIEKKIEEYHSEILKYREKYLKEPEEVESVHKLRVKIRQFRSLITLFKPLMKKSEHKYIQNELRAMAQECAYLRELDVLKKEWSNNIHEFKEKGLTGENFLAILNEERESEQKLLFSILEKPQYAYKLDGIHEYILDAIKPDKSIYLSLDEMVDDVLNQWHDDIEEGYNKIDENDLTIIHALRIKAKKVRYVMEVFGLDKNEEHEKQYKEIKRWQEVLGEITDANRNSEAVNEIAERYKDRDIAGEVDVFNEIQKRDADELYADFFEKHTKSAQIDKEEVEE